MIEKHVTATYRCVKSSSVQSVDLFTNCMASILRRTLSPAYHDRAAYQNVVPPFSVLSPSHKYFSISNGNFGKHSYPVSSLLFSKLIKTPSFRKFFARCALFFLLGFVFAISPFSSSNQYDFTSRRSAFETNTLPPPSIRIEEKTVVSREEGDASAAAVTIGSSRKQLILITATYNRALQYYYLSRLSQTVRLVAQPVLWIVVEMDTWTTETSEVLRKSRVMYRHLVCKRNARNGADEFKDRGVRQRNVALEHIEKHKLEGIVYFADDDNIYSLEMFERLRDIRRFGTWPVAMLAASKKQAILEGPVCNASLVIGWHTNEKSKRLRRFHVDMSGFAFNSTILWDPKTWGRPTSTPIRQLDSVKEGFQETTFIEQVVEDESQMEGTPSGCLRVMNWHLHLDAHDLVYPKGWVLLKNLDAILPIN